MRLLLVILSLSAAVFLAIYNLREIRTLVVASQVTDRILAYQRQLLSHAQVIQHARNNRPVSATPRTGLPASSSYPTSPATTPNLNRATCNVPAFVAGEQLGSPYDVVMQAELKKKAYDLVTLGRECRNLNGNSDAFALSHIQSNLIAIDRQLSINAILGANLVAQLRKTSQQKTLSLAWLDTATVVALVIFWSILIGAWLKLKTDKNHAINRQLNKKEQDFTRAQQAMISILEDTKIQAENAFKLAKDNQQLASIVQQSREAIIRLNTDKTLFHANPSAETLFNLKSHEVKHFTVADLFPDKATQTQVLTALNQLSTRNTSHSLPIELQGADGEPAYFDLSLSLLTEKGAYGKGYALVARDVTHLHEEQNQLQSIIEQAPNALILTDEQGHILMYNARAMRLFGYDKEELTGQSIEVLMPDAIRTSSGETPVSFLRESKARAMGAGHDSTARMKNGKHIPVEIGLNPLHTKKGTFVIASVVDISERLRSQQKLQSINDQLQQKNYEMEQFIYTVSHDLKTPLVTIGGFTDRLQISLGDAPTEKQEHYLNRIKHSILHMEGLLSDLLQLSRVIKGELERTPLNTEAVVNNVLEQFDAELDQAQAKTVIQQPLAPVYANERMLSQCLQNLISNAIKYKKPDEPLLLTVATHIVPEGVALSISDNGLGIAPKYHKMIFKIFERLEVGEGTGIGLTIVRTAMEKHNGSVNLNSTPGAGSTFTLTFPKAESLNNERA